MRSYIVEVYVTRAGVRDANASARRIQQAVAVLVESGTQIRHVRTTFLPDDETCFHLVEAPSSDVVDEACRRAGLGHVRIVVALEP